MAGPVVVLARTRPLNYRSIVASWGKFLFLAYSILPFGSAACHGRDKEEDNADESGSEPKKTCSL